MADHITIMETLGLDFSPALAGIANVEGKILELQKTLASLRTLETAEDMRISLERSSKLSTERLGLEERFHARVVESMRKEASLFEEKIRSGKALTDAEEKQLAILRKRASLMEKMEQRGTLEQKRENLKILRQEAVEENKMRLMMLARGEAGLFLSKQQKAVVSSLAHELQMYEKMLSQGKVLRESDVERLRVIQRRVSELERAGALEKAASEERLRLSKEEERSRKAAEDARRREAEASAVNEARMRESRGPVGNMIADMAGNFQSEFQRRIGWFVSGQLWYGLVNGAKDAVAQLSEIEKGMVEIGRVMQDATFETTAFRNSLMAVGKEMGFTFQEVQPIALRWAQSGYDAKETLDLTRNSLLALNVAELDAKEATESLIGIMAQWNMKAGEMAKLIDMINKTADNNPITSQDIVDGLLKASGAAVNMNLTLEETIALLTVTKEASGAAGKEVGNALKSIISYVQRPSAIQTFENLGIDVFADKAKTQFRSVLDIFEDVSKRWDTASAKMKEGFLQAADDAGFFSEELATALGLQEEFNDLQKRDISQAAAGVFRRNYFVALIRNIEKAREVMQDYADVEGYSMRENEQTMQTREKRVAQLKAAWQELIVTMEDAGVHDILKTVISLATKGVEVLSKIPAPMVQALTYMGMMKAAVLAVDAAMPGKGTGGFLWMIEKVGGAIPALGKMTTGLRTLSSGARQAGADTQQAAGSVEVFGQAAQTAGSAVKAGVGSLNLWIAGIGLAVTAVSALVGAYKRRKEAEDQELASARQSVEKRNEEIRSLTELSAKLREAQQNDAEAGTLETKEALLSVQQELYEQYKVMPDSIDEEGRAHYDNADAVLREIEAKKALNAQEIERMEHKLLGNDRERMDDVQDAQEKIKAAQSMVAEMKAAISEMDAQFQKFGDFSRDRLSEGARRALAGAMRTAGDADYATMKEEAFRWVSMWDEEIERANEVIAGAAEKTKPVLLKYYAEVERSAREGGAKIPPAMRKAMQDEVDKVAREGISLDAMKQSIQASFEKMLQGGFVGPESKRSVDAVVKALSDVGLNMDAVRAQSEAMQEGVSGVADALEKTGDAAEKADGKIRNAGGQMVLIGASMRDVEGEVARLSAQYDELQKMADEMAKTHAMTAEQMKVLGKLYPDLAARTDLETDALAALLRQAIGTKSGYIQSQFDMTSGAAAAKDSRIRMLAEELRALQEFANAWVTTHRGLVSMSDAQMAVDRGTEGDLPTARDAAAFRKTSEGRRIQTIQSRIDAVVKGMTVDLSGAIERVTRQAATGMGSVGRATKGAAGAQREHNSALKDALSLLERRKKLGPETFATAAKELADLRELRKTMKLSAEEAEELDAKIYDAEVKYYRLRLDFSKKWIEERKRMGALSTEDEIAAWTRVKENQIQNIEAVKEAEERLHALRKAWREESMRLETDYLNRRKAVGILTTEEEIRGIEAMYAKFPAASEDERYTRIETLYGLYHKRIDDLFREIDKHHEETLSEVESRAKAMPVFGELEEIERMMRRLSAEKAEADKLDALMETAKRLRALRDEAKALEMDAQGLFAELPHAYLAYLDGALSAEEKLKAAHEARMKMLEEEAKRAADAKQREIDAVQAQIQALEDLEKAERRASEKKKIEDELAYWRVRTSEEARKKVLELEERLRDLEKEDARSKEKDALKEKLDGLKSEKDALDQEFRDKKKHMEDAYDLERRIREELARLNKRTDAERIQGQMDVLSERKRVLEEEKRAIEEQAQEEIRYKKEQYEMMKGMFGEHMQSIVALASSLSKDAFEEWMQNYIRPLQSAVASGHYGDANRIVGEMNDWIGRKDASNREYYDRGNYDARARNAEIYRIVERIVQLKWDWDKAYQAGNMDAAKWANEQATALREQLAKYNPALAEELLRSNYAQALRILQRLPKAHTGGKTLSYGAVYMKPGELVFPPDLSKKMEDLIRVLTSGDLPRGGTPTKTVHIENLLSTGEIDFRDRAQQKDVLQEMMRVIRAL